MNKEELEKLEKLKAELKAEMLANMKKESEKGKLWKDFREEIIVKAEKRGYSHYDFLNSVSYIIRSILGIDGLRNITNKQQIEQIRPIIN